MLTRTTQADQPTILVVDDAPDNLTLMAGLLKDRYQVRVANRGERALQVLAQGPLPDLILLDVSMPGLSGYEVCTRLKADARTRDIPVVFLTARNSTEDEQRGLALGGADFICKPVNPPSMLARVATQLKIKAAADFLRDQNSYLEAEVNRRTREVAAIQDVTILAMASLAETRDQETGHHIRRTQHYVKTLARQLRDHVRFRAVLDDVTIELLFKSAPLHDIGKVGIPDHILLKPGRLTPEEFDIMKRHAELGRNAIQHAEDELGLNVDFLYHAKEIAYGHHEKWDGSGYPQGLAGEQIPVSARLMAVADVYDALISKRVYKQGKTHEEAVDLILAGRGQHFYPDVVDAFSLCAVSFREIALRFCDEVAGDLSGQPPDAGPVSRTMSA